MEEIASVTQEHVQAELKRFPGQVSEHFQKAWADLSTTLSDRQMTAWARSGLQLAEQSVRSWEAASLYFEVSPQVAALMPFNYFVKWGECGTKLCEESPSLAVSYFEASPGATGRLRSRHIQEWSNLGLSLYRGTWKSSTLSARFFESSPALLSNLTLPELERFVRLLDALSRRSYDLALECLDKGQKIFPLAGDAKEGFITLAAAMAEGSWRQVKSFFDAAAQAFPRIEAGQKLAFIGLAGGLLAAGSTNVPGTMLDLSKALEQLHKDDHGRLLGLAEQLLEVSPVAMPEFIKSSPSVLQRVSVVQLERWFSEGMSLLEENADAGLAFFKTESARSERALEALSSSVELERIKDVIEMYCMALAGSDVKVSPSDELVEKSIGWVSAEAPATEGSTIFVPAQVDKYASKDANFGWFKVVSTHQVAHLEFGSFRFEFDRPSGHFDDLRPKLQPRLRQQEKRAEDNRESAREGAWLTDMQRFFDLFDDRRLALDIFTVVEDGRLDARVKAEYAGIGVSYEQVQNESLEGRPDIKTLPMREAMVELLVRLSLQQLQGLSAPSRYMREARHIAAIARRAIRLGSTVEDSAEATLRIFSILSEIPNLPLEDDEWENLDLGDDAEEDGDIKDDEFLRQLMPDGSAEPSLEEGEEYTQSPDVDFRGDFKPELVQLLARLRTQNDGPDGEASSEQITQEMLEEVLAGSAELDVEGTQEDGTKAVAFADNILKEAGLGVPTNPELGQGPLIHVDEDGGSLDPDEPQTFVYDEWDFRAEDYKPRWCIVRQRPMAEGNPNYYGGTLHNYGPLVNQIKRQFELMVPEVLRKVRKLESGEELDIDDVIEAFIDIRTGVGPSEKLFWRRNKVQRDVAVVFLLDTSASTAEAIDDSRKVADDWDAPDDPVEYMVWLRARRGEGMKRSYKRIIDLEKEAVVLLINALESLGDVYGIYGFSGYGRENVEFYTIKDIVEPFSEKVKSRIDRISPLHATRMGPAIRHATSKLAAQDARTKLLFLISDGRPQDRGYSREGVEKEYAVHDTKMALDEAKGQNVNAFCLTVDKNGHDYLKTMCQDIGYEVLDDIYTLPRRLLYLYKRLTT